MGRRIINTLAMRALLEGLVAFRVVMGRRIINTIIDLCVENIILFALLQIAYGTKSRTDFLSVVPARESSNGLTILT